MLATSTPVQPMGIVSRWASAGDEHLPTASILVADNSLGLLVAAEVVDEAVVAQACQLYGVALPCISSLPWLTVPPRRPHLRLSFANMAKRAFASPFHDFCQEQRPLLPADLKGSEKEQLLGQRWQALSPAAKAKRKVLIPVFTCGRGEHALGYPPRLSRRRQWRIS